MTENHPNRENAEEMRTGGSRVAIGLGSKKCLWLVCSMRTDKVGNVRV